MPARLDHGAKRLATAFYRLPLRFDAGRLAREVLAVPEAEWRPHPRGIPASRPSR